MKSHITAAIMAAALAAGALIAFADTRPSWDDTGIIAGALFISAAVLSFTRPRLAIPIAIAVGGWIPLLEMSRNAGSLIALGVALVGALCGAGIRAMTQTAAA